MGEMVYDFARWVVSLDDPDPASAGQRERRTVTLTQIIERARAALSADDWIANDEQQLRFRSQMMILCAIFGVDWVNAWLREGDPPRRERFLSDSASFEAVMAEAAQTVYAQLLPISAVRASADYQPDLG
jgi:hypothetical protein